MGLRRASALMLLAAGYLVAALASLQLAALGRGVTPLWLPSGIALGGLLVLGLRAWPVVAVAAAAAAAIGAGAAPLTMLAAAVGDTLEPVIGCLLLRRVLLFDPALGRAREVGALLLAAAVAPVFSATIGVPTFVASGFIAPEAAGEAWLIWWLGNFVGILVTTPAVLVLRPRSPVGRTAPRAHPVVGALLVGGSGAVALFGVLRDLEYLFLLLPPVLIATLIWRMRGAALAVLAAAGLVLVYAAFQPGQLIGRPSGESIVLVQSLLLVISVTALVLAGNLERLERTATDLRRTGNAYGGLIDASPFAIVGRDLEGRITTFNPAAERLSGWRADEVLGTVGPLVPPGDEPEFHAIQAAVARGERVDLPRVRRKARDGSLREVGLAVAPVRDAHGRVAGGMGILTDLSAERAALARLAASEERFVLAARASNDAIYDWNVLTDRIWWSESWESMFGHSPGESTDLDAWSSLVHPDDLARVQASLDAALASSASSWCEDYRLRRSDGTWAYVYDRGYIARDEAGRAVRMVGAATDMTSRREAEQQVRDSEVRLRLLVEQVLDVICEVDRAGLIRFASPSVRTVLGYHPEELRGLPVLDLVHPDDLATAGEALARSFAATGVVQRAEVRVRRRDGDWVLLEATGKALRSPDGGMRVIVAGRDVTARRQLEERLQRASRLEAVGVLAGGVAHDFNNLLTALLGHSDLILRDLGAGHPLREDVEEIRRAGLRAAELTRQLLAFSRRQVVTPQVVNLGTVVNGVGTMLRRLLGEDIQLDLDLAPDLPPVFADAAQLEQVVVNLAVNARDAMPHGGRLLIQTRLETPAPGGMPGVPAGIGDAPHLALVVEDTGEGMDGETLAHMFEPFYTTKPVGRGTGLGLATVYGIVAQAGGHVEGTSELGRGTRFVIRLPAAGGRGEPAPAAVAPPPPSGRRATETILLVEDEAPVRVLAERILAAEGYRVLAAGDAAEAERLAQAPPAPLDLLLTDVIMPDRSGPVLAEALLRQQPDLTVLYMSGYTDGQLQRQGVLRAGVAFLPKPFTPGELVDAVRATLDAARSAPV